MNWLEEYSDQGFVVFSNLLPSNLIDAHIAEVGALLTKYGVTNRAELIQLDEAQDDALMSEMLNLHRQSETAKALSEQKLIKMLLHQLFGEQPQLAMARSSFWEQGNMRAHVDTAFRSPEPPYKLCRIWCALEDIDPKSGTFYLVPGTHRSLTPKLSLEVLRDFPEIAALANEAEEDPNLWFRLHARGWPLVNAKVPDRIDANCKVSFDLKKGDIVIFNPALAHGTLPVEDKSLSRKMMVCEWSTKDAYIQGNARRSAKILPFAQYRSAAEKPLCRLRQGR